MTLLEEIQEERQELLEDAKELRDLAVEEAFTGVQHTHEVQPAVCAIVGIEKRIFLLQWENVIERRKVFTELNEELREDNATATVTVNGGRWVPDFETTDPDEVRNHPDSRPAIMVTTLTPHWKELLVYPYQVEAGEVKWEEPHQIKDFQPNLVQVPTSN